MNKLLNTTLVAVALTLGARYTSAAIPSGGHGGHGGGMSGGGMRGRTSHSAVPPVKGHTRPSSAPSLGPAVKRPHDGPVNPYHDGRSGGWPHYEGYAYGSALGLGYYGGWLDDPFGLPYAPYGLPYADAGPSAALPESAGRLRLDVTPKTAEVLVDADYAGIVDDFNGHFQHLNLVPGAHHIELRAPGYIPLQFDVDIDPGTTRQYHAEMVKK